MQQAVIRALMKVRPRQIRYDAEDGAIFREVFEHPRYRDLDETAQMALALEWAAKLYQIELEQPQFDQFFGSLDLQSHLAGAAMLDIGCYLGGRTVRWLERYRAAAIHGIDIDPRFIRVATRFAESRGARATFGVTFAEDLPHPDASFDAIISENTFEHVRDIRRVMSECARVLRPRGLLIVIFPPFWGPSSHHLDLVTRTPFLHWVFSYPALLKAYLSILDERGPDAAWYRRKDERPLPFERGCSINGTGAMEFQRSIKGQWEIVSDGFRQHASGGGLGRRLLKDAIKATRLDLCRELFAIAYVLRKP